MGPPMFAPKKIASYLVPRNGGVSLGPPLVAPSARVFKGVQCDEQKSRHFHGDFKGITCARQQGSGDGGTAEE